MSFRVHAPFEPAGDQARAIDELVAWIREGRPCQTMLGVTGSGKTYVMAKVIEALDRPALVVTHNKTLSAQLYNEFAAFFPEAAVEYFVSYYDYYQPEAYIPSTDTYIEKDASINDEIDRLRHRATRSIFERRDCLIVASVSCIYGLGSPEVYRDMQVPVAVGVELDRDAFLRSLVEIQYERADVAFTRGSFRVRGDRVDVFPVAADTALSVEFFGDEVDRLCEFDPVTGRELGRFDAVSIFPAKHYVVPPDRKDEALAAIVAETAAQEKSFLEQDMYVEAQRIRERTNYDLEMMREIGYCKGIENYSRHLAGRVPGSPPATLLDHLPKDGLVFIDESHVTVPQIGGMCRGDRARKESLVRFGFRLPSAFDNRPLTLDEFEALNHQCVYVSATPGDREIMRSHERVTELIVRPTGLVDPELVVRPTTHQVDDLVEAARERIERGERVLVTTLTKKMAEDLASYMAEIGFSVEYLHSEIDAIERVELLRRLRKGDLDVLVGINLLREGLDLPEVSLVAVLDADKEGFLRSTRSLIQVAGRAARNVNGTVILYADTITDSIRRTLDECRRRRAIQLAHNEKHGIVPRTIVKGIPAPLGAGGAPVADGRSMELELAAEIELLREEMNALAEKLRFEEAAEVRDRILALQNGLTGPMDTKGSAHGGRGRKKGRRGRRSR